MKFTNEELTLDTFNPKIKEYYYEKLKLNSKLDIYHSAKMLSEDSELKINKLNYLKDEIIDKLKTDLNFSNVELKVGSMEENCIPHISWLDQSTTYYSIFKSINYKCDVYCVLFFGAYQFRYISIII